MTASWLIWISQVVARGLGGSGCIHFSDSIFIRAPEFLLFRCSFSVFSFFIQSIIGWKLLALAIYWSSLFSLWLDVEAFSQKCQREGEEKNETKGHISACLSVALQQCQPVCRPTLQLATMNGLSGKQQHQLMCKDDHVLARPHNRLSNHERALFKSALNIAAGNGPKSFE